MDNASQLLQVCGRLTERRRNPAGFTMIELMITIAIIGILAAIAAPSFSGLIASQRAKGVAADLYVAVSVARSEAIKRNMSVLLSPKAGGWQAGWQILDPLVSTNILVDHAAITNATITGPTSLTYRASGRATDPAAPTTAPTFNIAVSGTTRHYCVTIDLSGRPSQKATSC